jgi:hypothetical protein
MSKVYRGPAIDASYQVSVHLAEWVSEEKIKMLVDFVFIFAFIRCYFCRRDAHHEEATINFFIFKCFFPASHTFF